MGVNGSEPSNGRAVDNMDNTDKIIDIANDTDIYNILIEWMKLTPALHVLSAKHKTFITASDKNCCTTCVEVKIMIILFWEERIGALYLCGNSEIGIMCCVLKWWWYFL